MKIEDLKSLKNGKLVELKLVMTSIEESETRTGGEMASVQFSDSTGTLKTPVFDKDSIEYIKKVGTLVPCLVTGIVNIWNGNVQLKNINLRVLSEDEYEASDFIGEYPISDKLIKYVSDTIEDFPSPYKEVALIATGFNDKNGEQYRRFMIAPSAEKHHGNKLGGLFIHTAGVLMNIDAIINNYECALTNGVGYSSNVYNFVNINRLKLKAILHDIEKINEYEYEVAIKRKKGVVGHIYDGITLITNINNQLENKLTLEDLESIKKGLLSHHGQFGPMEPDNTEDKLLHIADMLDATIVGELEKKQ